jgi:hypothetical protein
MNVPKLSDHPAVVAATKVRDDRRADLAALTKERDSATLPKDRIAEAARRLNAGDGGPTEPRTLEKIEYDLTVARKALELADAHLRTVQRDAARQIAEQMRPTYERILKIGAKVCRDAIAFVKAEAEFRDEMYRADVNTDAIRGMALSGQLDAGDISVFEGWLAEYATHYSA